MADSSRTERTAGTQNCGQVVAPPSFSPPTGAKPPAAPDEPAALDEPAAPNDSGAPSPAYTSFRRQHHFASLNGVRCLSILAVLWHHSPHTEFTPATRGFLGVDLFFVLSGFLITTLLLRERQATGTISLRAFYMRRILRIFPLYYATLLGLVALVMVWRPSVEFTSGFLRALPWYATYTSNWGPKEGFFAHSWSLAVEEQFYLLWPPILVWLGTRRAAAALVAFLATNLMLDFGVFGPRALEFGRNLAPFTAIGLGVLLGIGLHRPPSFAVLDRIVGRSWSVVLPLLALAALVFVPGDIAGWPRLCIHLSMTFLVAAVVVPQDHALSALFRNRVAVHIGTISYGMYLLHGLCLIGTSFILGRREPDVVLPFFLIGTALTVIVATASYRWFERPFLRLKTRFERRRGVG